MPQHPLQRGLKAVAPPQQRIAAEGLWETHVHELCQGLRVEVRHLRWGAQAGGEADRRQGRSRISDSSRMPGGVPRTAAANCPQQQHPSLLQAAASTASAAHLRRQQLPVGAAKLVTLLLLPLLQPIICPIALLFFISILLLILIITFLLPLPF